MRASSLLNTSLKVVLLILGSAALGACSANASESGSNTPGGGGSGVGGSGAGGGGHVGGSGGGPILDASYEQGSCTGVNYPGKVVPLDVAVLLDATASMNGANDTPVVWPDVVDALIAIVSDVKTEGMGMGLTFLPQPPPDGFVVPGSCKTEADCGGKGACKAPMIGLPKMCENYCTVDTQEADCGLYGVCTSLPGIITRFCDGAMVPNVSCDPVDYAGEPAVPIAELPGNKDALVQAISQKDPDGDATPTQPSLDGALRYAHQWAVDHPTHLTHVLFATDGLPNDCTFNTIDGAAAVASAAYADVPSVPTFVLGIGELSDLNAIASAGGTDTAYIANASSVAATLVNMFNEIRANGACQFQLPEPDNGQVLDFGRVNVSYTPLAATEPVVVKYVGDPANCDPTEGGWYYDDTTAQHPTKILLCPATCEGVKLSDEGVSVEIGCKTITK